MSSSVHVNNKEKDILILGEDQRKDSMVLHLQKKHYILSILNNPDKGFVISLNYNGSNSFLFVNVIKV